MGWFSKPQQQLGYLKFSSQVKINTFFGLLGVFLQAVIIASVFVAVVVISCTAT